MKVFILILVVLCLVLPASADYTFSNSTGWINSTFDNVTEDEGDHYLKIGIFADNFEDNNLNGWTTTGGTHTVTNGEYKQQTAIVEWITVRPTTFLYTSPAVILAKVNVTDNGTYLDEGLGWGSSIWNQSIDLFAGRRDALSLEWELRVNNVDVHNTTTNRTLNVWSNVELFKKSNSYNYSSSYDDVVLNTSNSPTNSQYPYLLGSSEIIQFWDDVRIVPLDPNNNIVTKGNLTTWYDAGIGKETYQIDVNAMTPANTNYTVLYGQNGTGIFTQLGNVYTGNSTIALSPRYRNTDLRIILNGNTTATPELIEVTFVTQTLTPPEPANLVLTNGTNWVNATWDTPTGNTIRQVMIDVS